MPNLRDTIKKHWPLLLALVLFSVLFLPFLGVVPYLDGQIQFVMSVDLHIGGLQRYFGQWPSVHPPLKFILADLLFSIFGINPVSYNIIGYFFGVIGIFFTYLLSLELFGPYIAACSTVLLSIFPLFIASGLFSMLDYMIAALLPAALYWHVTGKKVCYVITCALIVITKETGVLIPASILAVEAGYAIADILRHKRIQSRLNAVFLIFPFIVSWFWTRIAASYGKGLWGDWIFSDTASKGSVYTVVHNLITLEIFNKYAYQSWMQLFFLNFNWIYWLVLFVCLFAYFDKYGFVKMKNSLLSGDSHTKTICAALLFAAGYALMVLSFQTYTIPRYAMPVLAVLTVAVSWAIFNLSNLYLRWGILVIMSMIACASLFFSVDPVSLAIWGGKSALGQALYDTPSKLAGLDGLTYNYQFLLMAQERSARLFAMHGGQRTGLAADYWVSPDPNNDLKTLAILKIGDSRNTYP
jgi:4-amino-4-deoxy-L-arabinose transferase-like glycosyltransferase